MGVDPCVTATLPTPPRPLHPMGDPMCRWMYVAIVVDGRFVSSPSTNGTEWRYKAEASGGMMGSALNPLTDPTDRPH